jgi:tricorn protease
VLLTVGPNPGLEGSREVLVRTLDNDYRLRNLEWIDQKREAVAKASGGRIGYVYVPDTGTEGQTELVRQFRAQFQMDGLIIDERFNSGGQIPDRFVELLNRPILSYWAPRDGEDGQWPPIAHPGPQAMLINGWSGSGGDCFPLFYKEAGLGPLIGTRTWGGLIGISGNPPLIDGGAVTVPTVAIYSKDSRWIVEGHGVDPDIRVVDDPSKMASGGDPQLERAIAEVMGALARNPPKVPARPAYTNRAGQ